MHPALIEMMAKQRQRDLAQGESSRRANADRSRQARHVRTRLGWLLVEAGSRLIVAEMDTVHLS